MNSVCPASASVNRLQKAPAIGLTRRLCDSGRRNVSVKLPQMERNSAERWPQGDVRKCKHFRVRGHSREGEGAPETKTLSAEIPLDFL